MTNEQLEKLLHALGRIEGELSVIAKYLYMHAEASADKLEKIKDEIYTVG